MSTSAPATSSGLHRPLTDFSHDPALKARVGGVLKALAGCTKAANALPAKADGTFAHELYMANAKFNQLVRAENDRALQLVGRVLSAAGCQLPQVFFDAALDDDERLHLLVAANDALLERVGRALDEAEGHKPETAHLGAVQGTRIRAPEWIAKKAGLSCPAPQLQQQQQPASSSSIARPQAQLPPIDNSTRPFLHALKHKHNAKQPHDIGNVTIVDEADEANALATESDSAASLHPYAFELRTWRPFPIQLQRVPDPQVQDPVPKSLSDTPFEYVDTAEKLQALCQVLKQQREFGVDLEIMFQHNDYRSYLGLTCLVQISTRDRDYVIDPFPVWSHMPVLNDAFSDPKIVKVLHGANSDINWLQRDFHVYVVNMFDTGLAARRLSFAKYSLQFVVQKLCGVQLDKQHQCKDWRQRPLPADMLDYARSDTHYLLACYDRLRNQLLDGEGGVDGLVEVLNQSKQLCAKVYQKPSVAPAKTAANMAAKCGHQFDGRQRQALHKLAEWRDQVARAEDESVHYVLPQHMMLQMALTLPRETQGMHALCVPMPVYVRRDLPVLQRLLVDARDAVVTDYLHDEQQGGAGRSEGALVSFVRHSIPWLYDAHDYSHTKSNEEMPPIVDYAEQHGTSVTAADVSLDGVAGLFGGRPTAVLLRDGEEGEEEKQTKQHTGESVLNAVTDWITPYQQHLLAEMARQKNKAQAAKPEEFAATAEKTTFSHRDPSTGRGGPITDGGPAGVDFTSSVAAPTAAEKRKEFPFDARELMTKKALQKLKKSQLPVQPDLTLSAAFGNKKQSKKRQLADATDEPSAVKREPFDYAGARVKLENDMKHNTTPTDVYDPHGTLAGGSNGGRDGRGGRGRGRGRGGRGGNRGGGRGGGDRGGRIYKKQRGGQAMAAVFGGGGGGGRGRK